MRLVLFSLFVCNPILVSSTSCSITAASGADGTEDQLGESNEHQHRADFVSLLQTSVMLQFTANSAHTEADTHTSASKLAALSHRAWEGEDLTEEDHDTVVKQLFNASSSTLDVTGVSMTVVGMFGSGTNLMKAFVEANFGLPVSQRQGHCSQGWLGKTSAANEPTTQVDIISGSSSVEAVSTDAASAEAVAPVDENPSGAAPAEAAPALAESAPTGPSSLAQAASVPPPPRGAPQEHLHETVPQVPCDDFWKHTHPFRIKYFDDDQSGTRPTTIVAMVRNPLSQLASWKRQSFNLYSCVGSAGECTCDEEKEGGVGASQKYYPCGANATDDLSTNFGPSPSQQSSLGTKGMPYSSLMGVWNSYTNGYESLAHGGVPVKVIVVRYEDLVQEPLVVLERIATEVGAKVHDAQIVQENARKFDIHSKDRNSALEAISSQSYRQGLSEATLSQLCAELDTKLLTSLGYENECPHG